MKIQCLFILRNGESGPELLTAWDEYTVMENAEGWTEDCEKALAAVKTDIVRHAYVDIEVDDEELAAKLVSPCLKGKIRMGITSNE